MLESDSGGREPENLSTTNFSIKVESILPGPIHAVCSESHAITPMISENTARVEVNGPVLPVSFLFLFCNNYVLGARVHN